MGIMRLMRLRLLIAWSVATLTGLTVSWLGVQQAVSGATYDDALGAVPAVSGRPPTAGPVTTPTAAPDGSASPSRRGGEGRSPAAPSPTAPNTSAGPSAGGSTGSAPAPSPSGRVRTYAVKSGRVVLSIYPAGARLVSASPEQGFQVKTARNEGWLRVDLTDGVHGSAVFATWNGHPTMVQVYEY